MTVVNDHDLQASLIDLLAIPSVSGSDAEPEIQSWLAARLQAEGFDVDRWSRDYSSDDQFRSIDWRATARRRVLTVRDHQANESQRVVFAIDCGRMMVNRTGGESLLDAASYGICT